MAAASPLVSAPGVHPVIGRREVTDWLHRALERIQQGKGGAYLLVGETGVGKSTLAAATAEQARGLGFLVLEGRALPREVPQPFEALKDALRTIAIRLPRASDKGEGALRAIWVPERQAPATMVPLGLMAWRAPSGKSERDEETDRTDRLWATVDRAGSEVEADRLALFERLLQAITATARDQPALLMLEDIQNADPPTLEFVRYLTLQSSGHALGILLTSTPVEGAPAFVREIVEGLGRDGFLELQAVRPLAVEEVRDYLRWLGAGKDPAEDLVTRLFAESEGNPLFLERLARGERGRLTGGGAGGSGEVRSGSSGPALETVLLEEKSELGRKLLVYGAVLGMSFPFSALARVSDAEEEHVAAALERLVRRGVLVEGPNETYLFRVPGQRDEVLSSLTETRRRRLHRRLAEVLEVLGAPENAEEGWIRELALHFHLGRQDLRSFEYNCRLFEISRPHGRVAESREALDRALEATRRMVAHAPERRDQEREVVLKLGETLAELGELRRSQERLMEAFQLFLPNEPHEAVQIALARTHLYQGRYQEAHRRLEGLAPPLHEAHPSPASVEALGLTSKAALVLGRADEARAQAERALRMAETLPDTVLLGDQLRALGDVHLALDPEPDRARALYQRAHRLFEEGHDPLRRSHLEVALAETDFQRGRSDEGYRRLASVIAWAEENGARLVHAEALLREAHHALDEGALDRASVSLGRSRALVPGEEGPRYDLRYNVLEGRHAHHRGEHERGGKHLVRARELAQTSGAPEALVEVLIAQAEGALAMGRPDEAKQVLAEVRTLRFQHLRQDRHLERLQRQVDRS